MNLEIMVEISEREWWGIPMKVQRSLVALRVLVLLTPTISATVLDIVDILLRPVTVPIGFIVSAWFFSSLTSPPISLFQLIGCLFGSVSGTVMRFVFPGLFLSATVASVSGVGAVVVPWRVVWRLNEAESVFAFSSDL
jgi:hypothetical protein